MDSYLRINIAAKTAIKSFRTKAETAQLILLKRSIVGRIKFYLKTKFSLDQ